MNFSKSVRLLLSFSLLCCIYLADQTFTDSDYIEAQKMKITHSLYRNIELILVILSLIFISACSSDEQQQSSQAAESAADLIFIGNKYTY